MMPYGIQEHQRQIVKQQVNFIQKNEELEMAKYVQVVTIAMTQQKEQQHGQEKQA